MPVSLVFTVLNEAAALPRLLDSLAAQTRPPDEVIVCDGGSRDGTLDVLRAERRFPLRIIEAPGANISRGRNLAIAAATHDIIACTDAGVRLDPRWLENLLRFWILDFGFWIDREEGDTRATSSIQNRKSKIENPDWVGGFFLPDPDPRSAFEVAMSATVLPEVGDIDPARFLPSSRSVAFLKTAWQQAGGYPEWLDYCEDLVFDFNLRAAFGACAFAPDALVYFRPRSSLRSFFRQYYLYARGDGKANLWLKRHLVRYATYGLALPTLLAGITLSQSALIASACAVLLVLGAAAYTRTPYRRLTAHWQTLPPRGKVKAALLVPVLRVVGDWAKMLGYPVVLAWRLKRRPADKRPADAV